MEMVAVHCLVEMTAIKYVAVRVWLHCAYLTLHTHHNIRISIVFFFFVFFFFPLSLSARGPSITHKSNHVWFRPRMRCSPKNFKWGKRSRDVLILRDVCVWSIVFGQCILLCPRLGGGGETSGQRALSTELVSNSLSFRRHQPPISSPFSVTLPRHLSFTSHKIHYITPVTRHCHANILAITGQENNSAKKKISSFLSHLIFHRFNRLTVV